MQWYPMIWSRTKRLCLLVMIRAEEKKVPNVCTASSIRLIFGGCWMTVGRNRPPVTAFPSRSTWLAKDFRRHLVARSLWHILHCLFHRILLKFFGLNSLSLFLSFFFRNLTITLISNKNLAEEIGTSFLVTRHFD